MCKKLHKKDPKTAHFDYFVWLIPRKGLPLHRKKGSQYESARLSSPTRFSVAVYNAS